MSIDKMVITLAELREYPYVKDYTLPDYGKFRGELLRLKEAYGDKVSQYKDEWNKKTRFRKLKAIAGELNRNLKKLKKVLFIFR